MDLEKFFKDGCVKIGKTIIPFPAPMEDFLEWIELSKEVFERYRFDQLEKSKKIKRMGLRFIGARRHVNQVIFTIITDRHKKIPGLRKDKDELFTGRPMDNYNDACKATLITIWEMIVRRIGSNPGSGNKIYR